VTVLVWEYSGKKRSIIYNYLEIFKVIRWASAAIILLKSMDQKYKETIKLAFVAPYSLLFSLPRNDKVT
jgi:hypothetical protein